MANKFWRKPIIDGDEDAWGEFLDEQNKDNLGVYTCSLYDDSGDLKVAVGRIGIDDGTNVGVSVIDTITTIDISGVTNALWAKIEMTVAGAAVTFAAADIAGATSASALPAGFTGSYDGEKGGFYISATKRTIGIAWLNTAGTLEGIINCIGNQDGYNGYSQSDDAEDIPYYFTRIKKRNTIGTDLLKTPGGRWPTGVLHSNSSTIQGVFNALIQYMTYDGFKLRISGGFRTDAGATIIESCSHAVRNSPTQIAINGFNAGVPYATTALVDNVSVVAAEVSLSW